MSKAPEAGLPRKCLEEQAAQGLQGAGLTYELLVGPRPRGISNARVSDRTLSSRGTWPGDALERDLWLLVEMDGGGW